VGCSAAPAAAMGDTVILTENDSNANKITA
jgi:hypothetical protein